MAEDTACENNSACERNRHRSLTVCGICAILAAGVLTAALKSQPPTRAAAASVSANNTVPAKAAAAPTSYPSVSSDSDD